MSAPAFDAALHAAGLTAALAWRTVVGRVVRRTVARVAGTPPRIEHPLLDLLAGLLTGWLGFAIWSAVLKRGFGVGAPSGAFAIAEIVVIAALGAWHLAATPRGAWLPRPSRHAVVRAVTFVVLFGALTSADILHFQSDNVDQDQHVAWTVETAHQGVVPDRYEGTDTAIAYPLGLHALAVATASVLAPPHIVLDALPLLTTLLVVGLVCGATAALAAGRRAAGGAEPPLDLVLLEAAAVVALSLALFSGHFSVWPRYLVNGRQTAGLCQLVPVLAGMAVLLPGPHPPGRQGRHPGRRFMPAALLVAAFAVAGALAAALNPVLVPLQAVLSGTALAIAALRRQLTWSGVAIGAAVGGVLALAVVVSDPYLARRADLPGLRPAAAPYLDAVQADVLRGYTGRSCFTTPCVAQAIVSPAALAVAVEPILALTRGALELFSGPPAPLRYDLPAPGRHRFPDLTGAGLAPVHGALAPYLFALWPAAVGAIVLLARPRRLLTGIAAVAVALLIDAALRGLFRAVIDPGEPVLRLLPYYADIAAAVLFTQLLWPLLFVGAAFAGAARDTPRVRLVRLGAAGGLFAALAVSAAGPVAAGMVSGRPLEDPTRADLVALDRLERRAVPGTESFLIGSELGHPVGERWILPTDDALLFYLHARRPTLFLFGLDHTGRYGPAGFEATCAALEAGASDTPITRHRARWAVAVGSPAEAVRVAGRRLLCGRRLSEWFPAMRAADHEGRLTLVELWPARP